jgi:hypothetical protein
MHNHNDVTPPLGTPYCDACANAHDADEKAYNLYEDGLLVFSSDNMNDVYGFNQRTHSQSLSFQLGNNGYQLYHNGVRVDAKDV